jgi:hypothetical protein
VLEQAKLELVVPLPGARMVRLGRDEFAPRDQLVALLKLRIKVDER